MGRRSKVLALTVVLFVVFSAVIARITPPEPRAAAFAYLFSIVLALSVAYVLVVQHGFLLQEE